MKRLPYLLAVAAVSAVASAFHSTRRAPAPAQEPALVIRVNHVGYRPAVTKVAVACALTRVALGTFRVTDMVGNPVLEPLVARPAGSFGPCVETYRLDFSRLQQPGHYRILVEDAVSSPVRIALDARQKTGSQVKHALPPFVPG